MAAVAFGPYTLLRPLGKPGVRPCHVAADSRGSLCVIKQFPLPPDRTAWLAHARSLLGMRHEQLVAVLDAGEIEGQGFLALELIDGRDLGALWGRLVALERRAPVPAALAIAYGVAEGVGQLHRHGVRQVALSPSLVLLTFAGEVKVASWGLVSDSSTWAGHVAPEIVAGGDPDARSDIWAIGALLWELVAGRALPRQAGRQRLVPPSRLGAGSAAIDELLLQALDGDPAKRYPTADALAEALLDLAADVGMEGIGELLGELWLPDEIRFERSELDRLRAEELQRRGPATEKQPLLGFDGEEEFTAPGYPKETPSVPSFQSEETTERNLLDSGPYPEITEENTTPSADFYLGQVIEGRYRVESIIGQGGMGWVYEVEHIEIGRRLALKVLAPQFSQQPDLVARFRREARAASMIGHPNIVDITDFGTTEDGSVYFVMERLEGIELGEVLRAENRLTPERAVHVAIQMSRALAAAHAAGIIHRDLKPENVFLITRDGDADFVKILDFGVAKAPESAVLRKLTTPGLAMGTPEYMAPEQAAGLAADPRSDVYCIGAVLYEMLTGRRPHVGESVMEILSRKATDSVRPVRELSPEVSVSLDRVIMSCLERDPEQRPQSMNALEYELRKSTKGRGAAIGALLGLKGTTGPGLQWRGARETVPMKELPRTLPPTMAPEQVDQFASTASIRAVDPPAEPHSHRWKAAVGLIGLGLLGSAYWLGRVMTDSSPPPPHRAEGPQVPAPAGDVVALLEWAERAAEAGRWTRPAGDNVKEILERVRALAPRASQLAQLQLQAETALRARVAGAMARHEWDQSILDSRSLLEFVPDDDTGRRELASALAERALHHLGRPSALADATSAVEFSPQDATTHLALAETLLSLHRYADAAQEYRRVLAIRPTEERALKQLSVAVKGAARH